jgi:hypothetical protein
MWKGERRAPLNRIQIAGRAHHNNKQTSACRLPQPSKAAEAVRPKTARQRSTKKFPTSARLRSPPARYQCQTLLCKPRTARVSSLGSASGMAPCSIARARKVAHANSMSRVRARARPCLLLARGGAMDREARLLGNQYSHAEHLLLGEVEAGAEHRLHSGGIVRRVSRVRLELLQTSLQGVRHDHVQAVELRLEVVVERRRADADRLRHVGPATVLVAVPTEGPDCGLEDRVVLAARGSASVAEPPTVWAFSATTTDAPSCAARTAAAQPAIPAPSTKRSTVFAVGVIRAAPVLRRHASRRIVASCRRAPAVCHRRGSPRRR